MTIQKEIEQLIKSRPNEDSSKACLFNLIVYTHEPRRTQYFQEIIKMVMEQFPCRIFFIQTPPGLKEDELKVKVITEKTHHETGISCDMVRIEASGQSINRVYFLLLPLFVPDLPIYLIWGQDPTKEYTVLPHLQHFAKRLIVDSEATDDLQAFSWDMQNRISSTSIEIVDMNWARIGGWREVLAQIFDSQERFQQLAAAQKLQLIYNDKANPLFFRPETQAIYLQAWLASRLGWQYQKAEKQNQTQIIHYQNQGICQVELIPQTDQAYEPEEILELNVFGANDYSCLMKRVGPDQVKVKAANQYECQVPFVLLLPAIRTGRNFMHDVFYQRVSDHYIQVLKMISLVKWS